MIAPELLRVLDLSSVAITAAIGRDGALSPVGGVLAKLLWKAKPKKLPHVILPSSRFSQYN